MGQLPHFTKGVWPLNGVKLPSSKPRSNCGSESTTFPFSLMMAVMPVLVPRSSQRPVSMARKRSEEHTSELQSRGHLVCRLLLEKKKNHTEKETSTQNE